MKKFIFPILMTVMFFFFACKITQSEAETTDEDVIIDGIDENAEIIISAPIKWGLPISTIQLVTQTVNEKYCQSGWTNLFKKYKGSDEEKLIPLQPKYVKRFSILDDLTNAAIYALAKVGNAFQKIRLALVWPCFENLEWREEIVNSVKYLREIGWEIELTLSHHDSYPASLENFDEITTSGWANEEAPKEFEKYAEIVTLVFKDIIPKDTIIYLIDEPMGYLFNAYLGSGNWPPGGKKAGKSMTQALVNMQKGLYLAAKKINQAGFKAALAKNIRPLINSKNKTALSLDYIFNWWLLEALLHGCVDEDFNGECEKKIEPAPIKIIGLTFYGTMQAKDETVNIGIAGKSEIKMALPDFDFTPDSEQFKKAIKNLLVRFPEVEVGVAEIGFSASTVEKMINWFKDYRQVVLDLHSQGLIKNPFIQLHSLFECAEFSPGDWVFHLIEECDETTCNLTPWGEKVIEEILGKK